MDFYSFAPIAAVLDGAYQFVMGLSGWLAPVAGASSAALAIVLVTMVIRTALIPVGRSQVRAEIGRRRLAPHLQELQRRYRKNPELLQRKTMELYAAEKVSPFAGILPTLLQAPVLTVVYGLFTQSTINGHANTLLTQHLLDVPLGTSLLSSFGARLTPEIVLVYAVLLAVIAVVAWMSRRAAVRMSPAPAPAVGKNPADAPAPGMRTVTSILSWLPFLTVAFASFVPLAATIYLATTTTWTFVERTIMRRVMA